MQNARNWPAAGSTTRREFLGRIARATAAALLATDNRAALPDPKPSRGLIDVNVSLFRWPFRRLPNDQTEQLVSKLQAHGVTQAWAGSFEGLLHRDLAGVNTRLAAACRKQGRGLLLPFGSIDPTQPDWEEELRRCADVHRMPGIRLHPNYHAYKLDHPQFARLLRLAADRKLIVQIALVMEDERMMNPVLRVEPVDTAPLAQLIRQTAGLKVVLLNALRTTRGAPLQKLIEAGNVSVEISMLEGVGGIENLLENAPADRVLFGSHAPLFYYESAELKLQESNLAPESLRLIRSANAKRLLA